MAVAVTPAWAEDEPPPAIKSAKAAHQKAVNEARKKLLEAFAGEVGKLEKKNKMDIEKRLALIEVVEGEQKRFEEAGLIPWSEPMRPAALKYLNAVNGASAAARRAYTPVIERRLNTDEKTVAALRADLTAVVSPKVVARWWHNQGGPMRLNSDRTINDPKDGHTWELRNDLRLVLRWRAPNAPGGYWVDVCTISQDGSTYSGVNQIGTVISGKLAVRK
jgi:hypothetical protein